MSSGVEKQQDSALEDGSEYHITFPYPLPTVVSADGCKIASDGNLSRKKTDTTRKEPIVILLGWAGCIDKILAAYSAIYNENGCITLRYILPINVIFFERDKPRANAKQLLQVLIDRHLDSHPLFCHIFSNGGCTIYRHLTKLVHADPAFISLRFRGCVLDSCPSEGRVFTALRVYSAVIAHFHVLPRYARLLKFSLTLLYDWLRMLLSISAGSYNMLSNAARLFEDIRSDAARCPQLFLYSTLDRIVDSGVVDTVIAERRRLGVRVTAQRWDDTAHCTHLRHHRRVYSQLCLTFLQRCLHEPTLARL